MLYAHQQYTIKIHTIISERRQNICEYGKNQNETHQKQPEQGQSVLREAPDGIF